jgi:hypothetical protein
MFIDSDISVKTAYEEMGLAFKHPLFLTARLFYAIRREGYIYEPRFKCFISSL